MNRLGNREGPIAGAIVRLPRGRRRYSMLSSRIILDRIHGSLIRHPLGFRIRDIEKPLVDAVQDTPEKKHRYYLNQGAAFAR